MNYTYPKTFAHDPTAYWAWVALFLAVNETR